MDYYEHFKSQTGSDFPIYRGHRNQRGYGLGNWFKSIIRIITPFMSKHALPVLKKGAQIFGTEAIKTVANIATDKIAGKKFEESGKQRLDEGIQKVQEKWNQSGSGKRKFKKKEISIEKKKKKFRRLKDIFD